MPERDLKTFVDSKKHEICELERRLEPYDEVIKERDCLQKVYGGIDQWKECKVNHFNTVNTELLATYNQLMDKYKFILAEEQKWKILFNEQQVLKVSATDQLETLKLNETRLQCELAESEKNVASILDELNCVKVSDYIS